jgi:mRNA interferase RelE/StbE
VTDPYEFRVSARAERDLGRLPENVAATCVEFVFGPLTEAPHRVGGPLTGPLQGMRSARRGSYRINYAVNDDLRRVDVAHIDHRGDVYR